MKAELWIWMLHCTLLFFFIRWGHLLGASKELNRYFSFIKIAIFCGFRYYLWCDTLPYEVREVLHFFKNHRNKFHIDLNLDAKIVYLIRTNAIEMVYFWHTQYAYCKSVIENYVANYCLNVRSLISVRIFSFLVFLFVFSPIILCKKLSWIWARVQAIQMSWIHSCTHTHTFLFLFLWSYWYGILYPNGTSVNCLFNTLQSKFIIVFLHLGWCTGTRFISSRLLVIVCCHVFLLSFILSRFYFSLLKCKKNFHPKDSLSLSFKFERTKLFFFFVLHLQEIQIIRKRTTTTTKIPNVWML